VKRNAVILLTFIAVTSILYAQQESRVAINLGFFTAEQFLHMPQPQQAGFSAGLTPSPAMLTY
jgi:hypothetical protein